MHVCMHIEWSKMNFSYFDAAKKKKRQNDTKERQRKRIKRIRAHITNETFDIEDKKKKRKEWRKDSLTLGKITIRVDQVQ